MTTTATRGALTVSADEPRTTLSCSCKVCADNAPRVGQTLPLRASVVSKHLTGRKVTAALRHSYVHMAYDPSMLGVGGRRATGVRPA